jgi:hypothetical protein
VHGHRLILVLEDNSAQPEIRDPHWEDKRIESMNGPSRGIWKSVDGMGRSIPCPHKHKIRQSFNHLRSSLIPNIRLPEGT